VVVVVVVKRGRAEKRGKRVSSSNDELSVCLSVRVRVSVGRLSLTAG
jgi:hypothetical protein